MALRVTSLAIKGASLEGENPLPVFRERNHHRQVNLIEPFPEEKKYKLGCNTGFRVLPYRMQDRYSRKRKPLLLKKIILENKHLEASFLPEAGGRLISLKHKKTGRELLSCNPVFQPANLAIRNAWFSGGIEWNIGQCGHAFHTASPVFASIMADYDGEQFLRIYEFERCKRLFWQIDFHLPVDSEVLYAYTRVINPNEYAVPFYWWTNIAVVQTPETRIFAPSDDVIYIDQKCIVSEKGGFGYSRMPVLPSLPGKDFSYPYNSDFANEYFFQCPEMAMPWEASVYKGGNAFFEVSTAKLRYRKMFCWGNHEGGRHWQEFLSEPGTEYIEIQAGLAPTQLHGMDMPAKGIWEWTQAFGGMDVDAEKAHNKDWFTARCFVEREIKSIISEKKLYEMEALFRGYADTEPLSIVHEGSGWGALEYERMHCEEDNCTVKGLIFPFSTIGVEQFPWLHLLHKGKMPERDPDGLPGAWMIQSEWKRLLDESLLNIQNRDWYSLLQAGVMAFEEGNEESAEKLWKESAEICPSVWAFRNLAVAAISKGNTAESLSYMEKAWETNVICPDQALAKEYLSLLIDFEMYREAWDVFEGLPVNIRSAERVVLIVGNAAMELGKFGFLEQLFKRSFAVIREGELILTELWFKYHEIKLAEKRGVQIDRTLQEEVRMNYPPPPGLDFRLVVK